MNLRKETSGVREYIVNYVPNTCKGIDIGFGGDKIRDDFDGCDLLRPYGNYEGYKIDIPCDVTKGIPVKDCEYDVVYSSHLIEDFEDTSKILTEFFRICKKNGLVILVFPDQIKYEQTCKRDGTIPNEAHKIKEMGVQYIINKLVELKYTRILFTKEVEPYNCIVIVKK